MYCIKNNLFLFKNNNTNNILIKRNFKKIIFNNSKNLYNENFHKRFKVNFLLLKTNFFVNFKKKTIFFFSFSKLNFVFFNNFFKSLNNFFSKNGKLLIIDTEYKSSFSFINTVYGFKNILSEKNFFFLKNNYLTQSSYIFLYKSFLKKYKISSILVLNYNYFRKFFKILTTLNTFIYSFLEENDYNPYIDYYFFAIKANIEVVKLFIFNNVVSMYFFYRNYNISLYKKFYYNKFLNLL